MCYKQQKVKWEKEKKMKPRQITGLSRSLQILKPILLLFFNPFLLLRLSLSKWILPYLYREPKSKKENIRQKMHSIKKNKIKPSIALRQFFPFFN